VRLFFALEVPEDVKAKVLTAQQHLASLLPGKGYRLTKTDVLHVTLAFIGKVERKNLDEVKGYAKELCALTPSTDLIFDGLGSFPNWQHPRVLWIGVQEKGHQPFSQNAPLALLGHALSVACAHLTDHTAEERVLLHVTLARSNARTKKPSALGDLSTSHNWNDLGETCATAVVLYESTAGESGRVEHMPLARFPLKG
jgi:2'-5' RNA ligase